MNKALWVVQGLVAAVFVFAGVMKLAMPVDEIVKETGLSAGLLRFVSIAEILGGLGVVLPALLRIQPWLTPLAAAGLVVIMIGGVALSVPMGVGATILPLVTGVLAAFVAYGRWRLVPIAAKENAMAMHRMAR